MARRRDPERHAQRRGKCPWCGARVWVRQGLTAPHKEDSGEPWSGAGMCEGSLENPRGFTDYRPLWRDLEEWSVAADRPNLLNPAHNPQRYGVPGPWEARADARLAVLQEAVEVLVDLDVRDFGREVSPELALLLAAAWRKRVNGGGGLTTEDYMEAMIADGLRVRGGEDG